MAPPLRAPSTPRPASASHAEDAGPFQAETAAGGLRVAVLGLLGVIVVLLVLTTVLGLRNTTRMARAFSRDQAMAQVRSLERLYRQSRGERAVLQTLVDERDADELLTLEFYSHNGQVLASSRPGAVGTFRPGGERLLAFVLREEPLRIQENSQGGLDVWSVLRPIGWPPGRHGWHGGRWGRNRPAPEGPDAPPSPTPAPLAGGPLGSAGPVLLYLRLATAGADQAVTQAWLQAAAVGLSLILLLAGSGLILMLQRRSLALARNLHDRERLAALGELSAVLAHEIRNPLAAVKGHAQLALETLPVDAPPREGLEIIVTESTRLEGLVRSLLDFARPRPLQARPVALGELVRRVLRLRAPELSSRNVQLACELPSPPASDGRVAGADLALIDAEALEQVLHNLIGNALEAMDEGGTLTVGVEPAPDGVRLVVQDSGPGIAPELLERLFEPYVTGRARGTGLGLAVARQVVTGLGGRIEAQSEPGHGARFVLTLPRAATGEAGGLEPDGASRGGRR